MDIIKFSKIAGVSIATVSRAFTGRGRISRKTKERILKLAGKHGFTPNVHASRFRSKESKTIGLVFTVNPVVRCDYYSMELIQEVSKAIIEAGYAVNLMLFAEQQFKMLEWLREGRAVDGLIMGAGEGLTPILLKKLVGDVPCVLLGSASHLVGPTVGAISISTRQSVASAVSYLAGLGHRRIGFIHGLADRDKFQGFKDGLKQAGIPLDTSTVVEGGSKFEDGASAMMRLLSGKRVTGVLACTDILALGAVSAIREAGLDVPRDVSVVGFDDLGFVSFFSPPLTTIRIELQQIGHAAMRVLSQIVHDRKKGLRISHAEALTRYCHTVPSQLVKRGTVVACK